MKKYKLGILGIGNMGQSILSGIIKSSLYNKEDICLFDIDQIKVSKLKEEGFLFSNNEKELIENVEILLLAIKPQMLHVLKKYTYNINKLVVVSIIAGKTIDDLKEIFGEQIFIRVMPNTPALINYGASAISRPKNIDNETFKKVQDIFTSIGIIEEIDDSLMNEVIPVNGSMPAYIYYFIKSFIDEAVNNGIEYDVAKRLATSTIIGSCKMITESDKSIDQLIKDVCSPKGATLEGLKVFEENNLDEIIKKASKACIDRAYELSKLNN